MQRVNKCLCFLTGVLITNFAIAQNLGGLQAATSLAESIKTWLFGLLGIGALIYLMVMALLAFTERKSWSDFGWAVLHVGLAGGAVSLGLFMWNLFQ